MTLERQSGSKVPQDAETIRCTPGDRSLTEPASGKRSTRSQFLRFAQVGVVGFFVDWGFLTLFLSLGTGFLFGRGLSYFCAAATTWSLNRFWTFQLGTTPPLQEFAKFLSANAVGGSLNYGVSATIALLAPAFINTYPVFAVAAGSLAGLLINFILSKRYVFTG